MLSGGQKQRISFARSMLENCELFPTEQEYYRMPIIFWFWNREKL